MSKINSKTKILAEGAVVVALTVILKAILLACYISCSNGGCSKYTFKMMC